MLKKVGCLVLLMCFMSFGITSMAWADENEVSELKNQVNDLNNKLDSLERYVKTMESHITPTEKLGQAPIVPPGGAMEGDFIRTMKDIHMSGYVDVQYNNNLSGGTDHRTPAGAQVATTNPGRIFDTDHDSFTVNAVELDFQRSANPDGGAGFRADIQMGEDSEVVDFDASTDLDEFSIQQAYVEYNQPLGFWEGNSILPDKINIKGGRFVTLAGNEVIEAKDNWNISRSFAFGFAIPFTHTGVRTNFGLFDGKVDTYLGWNNGWDNVVDNNSYKTLELGAGWKLMDNVSLFHTLYWGPENNNQNGHRRWLTTHVLGWDITDKFSVKGEFNQGYQNRVFDAISEHETASWQSYAAYGRYQITDKNAVAYRAELFKQDERFRTTLANTLWEHTFTAERKLTDDLIGRLEYRFDKSNDLRSFDNDTHQSTIGAQVIYII